MEVDLALHQLVETLYVHFGPECISNYICTIFVRTDQMFGNTLGLVENL